MAVLGWQVVRGLVKGARAGEAVVFKILGFVKVWVRFGSTDRLHECFLGEGSQKLRLESGLVILIICRFCPATVKI